MTAQYVGGPVRGNPNPKIPSPGLFKGTPLTGFQTKLAGVAKKKPSTRGKRIFAGSFKKGGKVKKTGMAKVHKGERVLNKKQAKKFNQKKYDKTHKKLYGI